MSDARPRPALHFTPTRGWMNDPHGIVRVGGQWHLFFQAYPDATTWQSGIEWGHAVSTDLVHWTERGTALAPLADEVGCWSGSVVVTDDGPLMLYTRIVGTEWGRGQVALAAPVGWPTDDSLDRWEQVPGGIVVDGPPLDPDGRPVHDFRDPFVTRTAAGWRAVLGGQILGTPASAPRGCAVQLSSSDLRTWTYDGVLASRPADATDPWTGATWECPQLVQVDGAWVLIQSTWLDDDFRVYAAIGDYDGRTFTARRWTRLSHGHGLYATTTFTDDDGRVCAMSWFREAPDGAQTQPDESRRTDSPWAGAQSLVHVLGVVDDRLVVRQHPSLDRALTDDPVHDGTNDGAPPGLGNTVEGNTVELGAVPLTWRLRLDVHLPDAAAHARVAVQVDGDAGWHIDVTRDRLRIVTGDTVRNTTVPSKTVPNEPVPNDTVLADTPQDAADEPVHIDLVVDTDLVECTSSAAEGIAAVRLPFASTASHLRVTATTGATVDAIRLSRLP